MTCPSMVVHAGNRAPVDRVDGQVHIEAYRVVISRTPSTTATPTACSPNSHPTLVSRGVNG
jgi:hypothetical protein